MRKIIFAVFMAVMLAGCCVRQTGVVVEKEYVPAQVRTEKEWVINNGNLEVEYYNRKYPDEYWLVLEWIEDEEVKNARVRVTAEEYENVNIGMIYTEK